MVKFRCHGSEASGIFKPVATLFVLRSALEATIVRELSLDESLVGTPFVVGFSVSRFSPARCFFASFLSLPPDSPYSSPPIQIYLGSDSFSERHRQIPHLSRGHTNSTLILVVTFLSLHVSGPDLYVVGPSQAHAAIAAKPSSRVFHIQLNFRVKISIHSRKCSVDSCFFLFAPTSWPSFEFLCFAHLCLAQRESGVVFTA